MADDYSVTEGSGLTFGADEVSGVKYPRVKPVIGADGVVTDTSAGAGAVDTGTQRTTLASDDPAVVALQVLDDIKQTEDAAHSTGHGGALVLGVRRDAKAVGADTDGDYATFNLNANGDLRVDAGARGVPSVQPTVTAGAYTAGDILGGEMTIANAARVSGAGGSLKAITAIVEDDSGTNVWAANDIEVLIFDSNPAGTYTDNAAMALTDDDAELLVAAVTLDTKYKSGNVSVLSASGFDIPYVCSGSSSLFAVAVNVNGRQPAATDAIRFKFHLERD